MFVFSGCVGQAFMVFDMEIYFNIHFRFTWIIMGKIYQETSENGREEENFFFRVTEAIFVGWFTLEFLIRFVVSPSKVCSIDIHIVSLYTLLYSSLSSCYPSST